MTSGTLSAKALELLPQLNKSQFIFTFIREQKSHANTYTADGQKYMASWDILHPPSPVVQLAEMPRDRVDFSTPILKARVSNQPDESPGRQASHSFANSDKDRNEKSEDKITTRKSKGQPVKNRPIKRQPSLSITNSEMNDQALRAKERREKKRAKRAITRPIDNSNDSNPHLHAKPKKGKRGKTAKGKKDGPSGLSLMYGFAAPNIANHRLTIMPDMNTGFFGKGKASYKKATSQRQNKLQPGFSESEFLNPAGQKNSAKKTSTTAYSSKSSQVVPATQELKKQGCSASSNDNVTSSAQKDGSIIWDIERDDFVLPSGSCTSSVKHLDPEVASSKSLRSTIVHRTFDNPCDEPMSDTSRVSTPSSIHPSESASQIEPMLLDGQPNWSKYFEQPSQPLQQSHHLNTTKQTVSDGLQKTLPIPMESVQSSSLADNEVPAYEFQPTGRLYAPSLLFDDLAVFGTESNQQFCQNEQEDSEAYHEDVDRGPQEEYCNPANSLERSDDLHYYNSCDGYDQVEETSPSYEGCLWGVGPYVETNSPFWDQPKGNDQFDNSGSFLSPNLKLDCLIADADEGIPGQDEFSYYSIVPQEDIRNEDLASLDYGLSSIATHSDDDEVEDSKDDLFYHPLQDVVLLKNQAPGRGAFTSLHLAEMSVAYDLKNHWHPQRL